MKKWIIPVVTLIILVGGVAAGILLVKQSTEFREKAAPATTLSFSTAKTTVDVGEKFIISTIINSTENQIAGVQLAISYNPNILQIDSVTKGNFLGELATTTNPVILSNQGLVDFSIFLPPGSNPVQGSGTVAILTVTSLDEGSSTISFIDELTYELNTQNKKAQTLAYGINEDNVIASTTPINITVQSVGTTTASPLSLSENLTSSGNLTPTPTSTHIPLTPTPTQQPTNTPTPTPTNSSGIGGVSFSTPTPTPTSTPLPTNTPTPTTVLIAQSLTTPTSTPTAAQQLPEAGSENQTLTYAIVGSLAIIFSGLLTLPTKS